MNPVRADPPLHSLYSLSHPSPSLKDGQQWPEGLLGKAAHGDGGTRYHRWLEEGARVVRGGQGRDLSSCQHLGGKVKWDRSSRRVPGGCGQQRQQLAPLPSPPPI